MKNNICTLLAIFTFLYLDSGLLAQEFGVVPFEQVAETSHPEYPDAKAAYLVKNCSVNYEIENRNSELVAKYFYRIKIYTEAGIHEFANWNRYLSRNGTSKEYLKGIKATVHNIVDGKLTATNLQKSDIYKEDESDYTRLVRFPLPNVQIGSVIDIKYDLWSPFLYSTPKHNFQADIPVDYSEFVIYVPKFFAMTPVASGVVPLEREEKFFTLSDELRTTFTAKNVRPIFEDDYVLNIEDYKSSLKFELKSIQWPNQAIREFSESWETISEKLEKHSSFGKTLKGKIKGSEELISQAKALPKMEGMRMIYDYVRSTIAWNERTGIYADQKLSNVWKTNLGSAPEMNLMLINLLRKADIKAYPLVTKQRSRGLLNQFYPSLTELNYVVVQAEVEGQVILLDATARYSPAGELPLRANNLIGLLVKKAGGSIVGIANNKLSYVKKIAKVSIDTEDVSLHSAGTLKLNNYAATRSRQKASTDDDSEDKQNLTDEVGSDDEDSDKESEGDFDDEEEEVNLREDIINQISVDGFEDPYSPIVSKFESTLYEPIQGIADELFVNAFVIVDFEENPFEEEEREYPAFFNFAYDHMYISVLEIPEGYAVEAIPENLNLAMEAGKGSFMYATSASAEKISIRCGFKINEKLFVPEDYNMLRRFIDAILEKQKEKIVLKKL